MKKAHFLNPGPDRLNTDQSRPSQDHAAAAATSTTNCRRRCDLQMDNKTAMKWSKKLTNSQVEKLIKAEKDLNKAIMIFDSGTAEYGNCYKLDHKTFRAIITKLIPANRFAAPEELLDRMKEDKVCVPENVFLTLCRGYGRVHRPLDAVRVFQKMKEFNCEASVLSYVTILEILVEENRVKAALRLYRYMRENDVSPTVASLMGDLPLQ